MEGGQQQIQNQQQMGGEEISIKHNDNAGSGGQNDGATNGGARSDREDEIIKELEGMSEEEILKVFAEGLLAEKGLGDVEPKEVKDELREDLVQQLTAQINQAVFNALPEDRLRELNTLLESDEASSEKINQIVNNAGIDMDTIVSGAMREFREVYLGNKIKREE